MRFIEKLKNEIESVKNINDSLRNLNLQELYFKLDEILRENPDSNLIELIEREIDKKLRIYF
jgi:hypothetical protein